MTQADLSQSRNCTFTSFTDFGFVAAGSKRELLLVLISVSPLDIQHGRKQP